MESINPSSKVRYAVYVLSIFINAAVAVLVTQVEVSVYVLAAVAGLNAVVAVIAGHNVTPDEEV